uniref:Uncharacterized protein n=1 Tax=Sus scrofa TaxID=9823 RepID=A0A8D0MZ61_PIG
MTGPLYHHATREFGRACEQQNKISTSLQESRSSKNALAISRMFEGTLLRSWWDCKLVQPLWKTVWRFFKKLKIELPYDAAIPLLGVYPEKTLIRKDTCTPVLIAVPFTIAKA